jgi:anti-sigma B factor antagonist
VDAYTCEQFRDAVLKSLDGDADNVILVMHDVDYIDSTGLGALVAGLKRAADRKARITLVSANPRVRRVFEITGLEKVFPIYRNLQDALASVDNKLAAAV